MATREATRVPSLLYQISSFVLLVVNWISTKIKNYKLEIWQVSTHAYVVSENTPFNTKAFLILLMSAFFRKKSVFFGSTFTQSNIVRAVLESF